ALRPPQADLARLVADSPATVVAVDVPSGVDASTGAVDGEAVRADVTVTFGALKPGLVVAPGAEFAGVVEVVDIGLDLPAPSVTLLDADDVAALLPRPHGETDKYRRGVVGVAAGSDTYTGAAVLAVGGALATGAGMVRFAGVTHPAELVRRQWPEAVVTVVDPAGGGRVVDAGRVQSWVVGSGLGTDDFGREVVRAVLATDVPVVIDADAITIVAAEPDLVRRRTAPTVLTPHGGEFARLVGAERADVEARRLDHVRRAAADLRATVLLKGSTSVIADPSGAVRVNSADTAYLATAGSGDVLSGICGALLAGGLDAPDAAAAGAFLHGMAGLVAAGEPAAPIVAMDIVDGLSAALRILGG
ncbi:MAG: NAD(P)H-hydrate dehydratase, partial [Frankiales bacterium]|nr:NAD(P)H-hydrate dehydratase [Frankiales bacterium]